MIEYVKPTATKTAIPKIVATIEPEVTEEQKLAIVALKEINEVTVRSLLHATRAKARQVLQALHAEGKIKTYSERYAELYPSEIKAKEL